MHEGKIYRCLREKWRRQKNTNYSPNEKQTHAIFVISMNSGGPMKFNFEEWLVVRPCIAANKIPFCESILMSLRSFVHPTRPVQSIDIPSAGDKRTTVYLYRSIAVRLTLMHEQQILQLGLPKS